MDANKAINGANNAIRSRISAAISSIVEKRGFARPSVHIEESPHPVTVAD